MAKRDVVLLSILETAYDEFKTYGAFYFEFLKEFREKRSGQTEFIQNNIEDEQKISDFILEYNTKPGYYAQDMDKLKERLITIYLIIQDIVEIPAELKKELDEITAKRNPILFKMVDGKPEVVSSEILDSLQKNAKEIYNGIINGFKQTSQ